jgi:hypothetical protein
LPGLLVYRLGKLLLVLLPILATASIAQSVGLDQHDQSEYKRDAAYVRQMITQHRHALRVEKIRIARIAQEGGGVSGSENNVNSLKKLIASYTRLESCLDLQRLLLRPSDDAWIYCKAEAGLDVSS